MAVEDVDPFDFLQVGAVLRVAVADQGAVGEGHVIGGNRLAVVEARLLAQVEHHPAAVLVVLHAFGDQAVARRRLVPGRIVGAGTYHQRLVEFADPVLQEVGCGRRAAALEAVGVEGVERTVGHHPQGAALGRTGVDPVEVGEVGRVFEQAELGVAVAFAKRREGGGAHDQAEDQR